MATPGSRSEPPLIVIVGPTASGKTALAVDFAREFGGEIICADSRTIYKGMDIGTAKPTIEEQEAVPHWGLDLVVPGQSFTAADFQQYALEKIKDIRSRKKVPFLVGGTGLYVDGVIFGYQFAGKSDPARRQLLEQMTLEELYKYCLKNNITLPENYKNKRYIVRAIEQNGYNDSGEKKLMNNTIVVGIATERDVLRTRIAYRTEQLFKDGVVKEATILGKKYGWDSEAMTGNIYPLVHRYLNRELTLDEMRERFVVLDWRLAKRQLTWLRRNRYIDWYELDKAKIRLIEVLENWR